MAAHVCVDCGLMHDMPAAPEESDEVKIARINREADVRIAQLSARQDKDWNETRVEVAEIEAGAQVEAAVAEAEIVGAAIEGGIAPEPEPIVIDASATSVEDDDETDPEELPEAEGSAPPEPTHKSAGIGFW